ncbi:hypothetical protein [Tranquillimonas rosea]
MLLALLAPLMVSGCAEIVSEMASPAMMAANDPMRLTRTLAEEENAGDPMTVRIVDGQRRIHRLLPNDTIVPGDNTLTYMNVTNWGFGTPVSRILGSLQSLPTPFEFVTERDFRVRQDASGRFYYAVQRPNERTTCAFALREVDFVGLEVSSGFSTTSKVLRNCVTGSLEEALAPMISDRSI